MAEIFEKPKAFTKEWFSYVWDYYKWYIICGIVAIALAIFTYNDIKNTVRYDANINYIGTGVFTSEKADMISAKCAEISDDLNQNDSVDISFTQLNFTEENRNNSELNYALMNKLSTLFADEDELIFVIDNYMLEQIMKMNYSHDIFCPASEWTKSTSVVADGYAVSLANSSVMQELGIDSSEMFVLIARADYEEGLNPKEINARKIAEFLIK